MYLTLILVANIASTTLMKDGGATLSSVVSTLTLPITNIAFALPIVMGEDVQPLRQTDVIGFENFRSRFDYIN